MDFTNTTLSKGTVPMDSMTNNPTMNYVNIVVVRELDSHAIFTTNGEDGDITSIRIPVNEEEVLRYTPGMMFMRKQTGSDRRTGKAIQRELLDYDESDTMKINEMNQHSVESALYGSAASSDDVDIGVTSRVMYDTAFTVRDSSTCITSKFQNAPGDEYAKGSTSGIREPDFFTPGTIIPSVITLRDVTPAEVAFVIAITQRNKRYGASTTRLGRVNNHIVGIYTGNEEGPSNKELTASTVKQISAQTDQTPREVVTGSPLNVEMVKAICESVYDDACNTLTIERLSEDEETDLLETAQSSDELQELLSEQEEQSRAFINDALDA
jgi:CRISPR-associated protein Csc2